MTLPQDNPGQAAGDVIDLFMTVTRLVEATEDGWKTWGPPEDRVQLATVPFRGVEYTLLRGTGNGYMAFTPQEWAAWPDGVQDGELNNDAAIPAPTAEKPKGS
jgi:hypothetical protein